MRARLQPAVIRHLGGLMDRLQWKLTLSYTLVSAVVILLLISGSLALLLTALPSGGPAPTVMSDALGSLTAEARPFLQATPPDRVGLATWLSGTVAGRELLVFGGRWRMALPITPVMAVYDPNGVALATTATAAVPLEQSFTTRFVPASPAAAGVTAVDAALAGDFVVLVGDGLTGEMVAVPVQEPGGPVLGALVLRYDWPTALDALLQGLAAAILTNAPAVVLTAAGVGAVLGLPTARWLSGRLRRLSAATTAWGRGDFSVAIADRSGDEIGQLGRALDRMAGELQTVLHDRERLAALEERHRLARDLHDSVTQALYSLTLYAEAAARRLANGEPEVAAAHLAELRPLAHEALHEMRLLIFELRPPVLDEVGLVTALATRLEAVEARAGLTTSLLVEGEEHLSPPVEEGLYRVAQEALNNVLKHARASRVRVTLDRRDGRVVLEIADDGVGFTPSGSSGGLGLRGMAERAARLGGALQIVSQPGGGTLVRVEARP